MSEEDRDFEDLPGDYNSLDGIRTRAEALDNQLIPALVERAEDRIYYDEDVDGYRIEPPETDIPDSLEMFFHFGILTGAALEREYPAPETDRTKSSGMPDDGIPVETEGSE